MNRIGSPQLKLTLRASVGTCVALGLARERCDVLPTTAYLLLGDRCRRTCAFCAQSSLSTSAAGMLSRVSWPEVDLDQLLSQLRRLTSVATSTSVSASGPAPASSPASVSASASVSGCESASSSASVSAADRTCFAPKRICIQVTDCAGALEDLCVLVPLLKSSAQIQVSVSYKPNTLAEIGRLLSVGVDRLGIAIDAAEPHIYSEVKGGDLSSAKEYLISAASQYPGKISTHVIVGLGESEESVTRMASEFIKCGITVALFAFTPVTGTPMQSRRQPDIGSYRRIQAATHLLRMGRVSVDDLRFEDGRIKSIEIEPEQAIRALQSGRAFQTSGCESCNRPFYNERPGSVMYNYPRPLLASEVEDAIASTGLWNQCSLAPDR